MKGVTVLKEKMDIQREASIQPILPYTRIVKKCKVSLTSLSLFQSYKEAHAVNKKKTVKHQNVCIEKKEILPN